MNSALPSSIGAELRACELLGVAPHGKTIHCVTIALWSRMILRRAECFTGALLVQSGQALAALAALQKHVARLHTELGVPQSLSTRAAVAQANKLLGLSPAGPLPVQAKALAAALGTSLD